MKLAVQEIIVVEGKNDTNALRRFIQCDTIETNGSAVSDHVIDRIKLAKDRRGVIIFTDPDFPGEKIRHTIERKVPGCKHAFITKKDAVDEQKGKVGVEHASEESIIEAIQRARPSHYAVNTPIRKITRQDLLQAGLLAGEGSKRKRELLGNRLNIGFTNGKQLLNRLTQFQITREEFNEALRYVERKMK